MRDFIFLTQAFQDIQKVRPDLAPPCCDPTRGSAFFSYFAAAYDLFDGSCAVPFIWHDTIRQLMVVTLAFLAEQPPYHQRYLLPISIDHLSLPQAPHQ